MAFESAADGAEQKGPAWQGRTAPLVFQPGGTRECGAQLLSFGVLIIWVTALEKSRHGRLRHGQCGWFGPDYAISRACHRLEGNSFAFSENRTKVTLLDPAQVENAIVTRRLPFFAAVIDGKRQQVSRRIGQEKEIYPASVRPPDP